MGANEKVDLAIEQLLVDRLTLLGSRRTGEELAVESSYLAFARTITRRARVRELRV